jgi:hypothetical protein
MRSVEKAILLLNSSRRGRGRFLPPCSQPSSTVSSGTCSNQFASGFPDLEWKQTKLRVIFKTVWQFLAVPVSAADAGGYGDRAPTDIGCEDSVASLVKWRS